MSFDNEYFDINTPTPCDYCNNYEFGCQKQGHRSFVLGIDFIFNNDDEVQCMYFEVKDNEKEKEMVNHPSHYNQGIEAIDYIESHKMNFNIGNVIKYVTRAKHKGTELEDLKKSLWYLQREIDRLEKEEKEK